MLLNDIPHILATLGIEALSPMQEAVIKAASEAHDMLLLAPTGGGKTLAYLLAALTRHAENPQSDLDNSRSDLKNATTRSEENSVEVVVVSPSRELARQGYDVFQRMKTGTGAVVLTGGHTLAEDSEHIQQRAPRFVFATPGRLLDHLQRGSLSAASTRLFIIDEYDKCLDEGFVEELTTIRRLLPQHLDTWLVSATTEPAHVDDFIDTKHTVRIDHLATATTDERRQTYLVASPEKDKLNTLVRLLSYIGGKPTIVFVSHRESVERVVAFLRENGFAAERYHGGMEQAERERSLLRFRCGGSNVLVATDLAARGIDIPEVGAVVNYHLPADEATFEHRAGRATRWENCGTAYVIISPTESVPLYLAHDTPYADVNTVAARPQVPQWAMVYIGRGRKEKLSKGDVAGFFCKKGHLRGTDIGRIEIGEHQTYVAVVRSCLAPLLRAVTGEKIKGMKTLIEEAH